MFRIIASIAVVCSVLAAADERFSLIASPVITPILLAVLTVCSAFFSGSEIAMVSISHARVRALVEKKVAGAHAIASVKTNPNRFLITILIGNNLVNIGASVLATAWATNLFGSSSLGWVTGILTLVVLIVGEIFPKTFAQRHNELFARFSAPILLTLQTVLLPIVFLLELLLESLMPKMGEPQTAKVSTLSELKALIRIVGEKREIDSNVQEILESTFEFDRTQVREIMTVRDKVVSVNIDDSIEVLRERFVNEGRSRIVVFCGAHAAGIVNMHMLLEAESRSVAMVSDIELLDPVRVEAGLFIDDLLIRLQAANQQLALVYDEGDFVGVVSVENILEEIVGEMHDEKEPAFRKALFGAKNLVKPSAKRR
ncbi:hypothetical protein AGMMS50229_03460 [Campylobacterota bacterium]|nr:hypothetical protein AGMMS50229_03460 [Campylobacterota bacterium]